MDTNNFNMVPVKRAHNWIPKLSIKILLGLIILVFIIVALVIAGKYYLYKQPKIVTLQEEIIENLFPEMNKTEGTVGFGEIFLKDGGKAFTYITYQYIPCHPCEKGRVCSSCGGGNQVNVNLFNLKGSDLKDGEKVIVYYNPDDPQDIIVYDLQNVLVYKISTDGTVGDNQENLELPEAIEIILDASGSMAGILNGDSKINIAKKAIETVINEVADDSIIGLRVYGSEGTYEEHNCQDTKLLFPITKIDKTAYISSVKSFTPKGWTPIDYVLRLSKDDFKNYADNPKKIILVSDGEETCGGDPCQAIKDLKNSGFDVVVDTIGFNVDVKTREQLKCISTASGGVYLDAVNAKQIEDILRVRLIPVPDIPPVPYIPPVPDIPPVVWPK